MAHTGDVKGVDYPQVALSALDRAEVAGLAVILEYGGTAPSRDIDRKPAFVAGPERFQG